MTLETISTFVKNIKNNGEFSTKVLTMTTPSWKATTDNPYVIIRKEGRKVVERIERVKKLTYYNNDVMIGGNYLSQVTNEIVKVGGDAKEWVAEPMKGTEWTMFPYLMKGVKNTEQMYVRFTMRKNTPKPKTIFFLDGVQVTDKNVIADILSWQKPHYVSVKQMDADIPLDKQTQPMNIKIENIIYVSQSGDKIGDDTLVSLFK